MYRILTALAAALAVAACVVATAAGSTPTVTVATKAVAIKPTTKAFTIAVTCLSPDASCTGVLDVRTAGKVKPYSSIAAKVATVGAFAFDVPAGTTKAVKGRVYGPALAEAMLRGRVRLSITPRTTGVGALGPTKNVLFTLKRS